MPARTVYRDPSTGRFISAEAAAELEEVTRLTIVDGVVTEEPYSVGGDGGAGEPEYEPYEIDTVSRWGARMFDGDDGLDEDRLGATDFPSEYDAFRVTYQVGASTRYERGFASTEWFGPSDWPPTLDMLEGVDPDAIGHIVFRRGQ